MKIRSKMASLMGVSKLNLLCVCVAYTPLSCWGMNRIGAFFWFWDRAHLENSYLIHTVRFVGVPIPCTLSCYLELKE